MEAWLRFVLCKIKRSRASEWSDQVIKDDFGPPYFTNRTGLDRTQTLIHGMDRNGVERIREAALNLLWTL